VKAFVKAARGPGGELREVPEPKPGEGEVLVSVRASSVCGTDVHIWEWNDWAQRRIQQLPQILGHELGGEVIAVGPGVQELAVGDRVSAETHLADGTCYQCRTGQMNICRNLKILGVDRDGVFAERVVLPATNAWKNDPDLDFALASIQEPLGNAVHALLPEETPADIAGKRVLVTGAGPIGLMAVLVAKTLGAERVIATEVNAVRAGLAKRLGADLVIDPREDPEGVVRRIVDATDGHGIDVATEMSGHPSSLKHVFGSLTPGGRVSLLGLFDQPASIDLDDGVIFKAAKIHGISGRRMFATWYDVKGLLKRPDFREQMGQIITHRVPIAELPKAMELIRSMQAAKVSLEAQW
jgi:threonine 3-dehydrogenase